MKNYKIENVIKNNNLDVIDEYLHNNDINRPLYKGLNIILLTIQFGNIPLLKYFVNKGYDITRKGNSHYSPIEYASICNNVDIVNYLLELESNIDLNDYSLIYASAKGFDNIVNILLSHKFNVNQLDSTNRNSLHWAAQEGHIDVMKNLISNGCNINVKDDEGRQPH